MVFLCAHHLCIRPMAILITVMLMTHRCDCGIHFSSLHDCLPDWKLGNLKQINSSCISIYLLETEIILHAFIFSRLNYYNNFFTCFNQKCIYLLHIVYYSVPDKNQGKRAHYSWCVLGKQSGLTCLERSSQQSQWLLLNLFFHLRAFLAFITWLFFYQCILCTALWFKTLYCIFFVWGCPPWFNIFNQLLLEALYSMFLVKF